MRLAGSVTMTKCHPCAFEPVGACIAIARQRSITAGSTGFEKTSRLRTERVGGGGVAAGGGSLGGGAPGGGGGRGRPPRFDFLRPAGAGGGGHPRTPPGGQGR